MCWTNGISTGTLFLVFASQTIIGSFSNDEGDGNEDVKKAIGLLRKTTTLHVHHAFCTFLYRPCTTTKWKCLIASFMEDVNKRRRISFFLSKLECGPQESTPVKFAYTCHFQQIGINATKIELTRVIGSWLRVSLPLLSSMLKLSYNSRSARWIWVGYNHLISNKREYFLRYPPCRSTVCFSIELDVTSSWFAGKN